MVCDDMPAGIVDMTRIALLDASPDARIYIVKFPNDRQYFSHIRYAASSAPGGSPAEAAAAAALESDIRTLRDFEHSSFARILAMEKDNGGTHVLTSYHELGTLGTLMHRIRSGSAPPLAEGDVLRLAVDLLLGLKYSHERQGVGLRLVPDCILLGKGLRARIYPLEGVVRRLAPGEDGSLDLRHVGDILTRMEACTRTGKFSILLGQLRDGLLKTGTTIDRALHLPVITDRFVLLQDVDRLKKLGSGTFGTTYLARHKVDGRTFALKQIRVSNRPDLEPAGDPDSVDQECAILGSINHTNVVSVYHVERNGNTYSILMELCSGGDLQALIHNNRRGIDEATALNYMSQICVAVEHLHRRRILHRDLKPANIFLKAKDSTEVRVGDFGLSKELAHTLELAKTRCGTPAYFSPELMLGREYGPGADVWACGVILFSLVTGAHPFYTYDGTFSYVRHAKGDVGGWPEHVSADVRAIVRACLEPDPKRRPNISQVSLGAIASQPTAA
eukprot:tig00020909_g15342.t1